MLNLLNQDNENFLKFQTDPKFMEKASRLEQHQYFHQQLRTFEKLLKLSHSKFNIDKLYKMLRLFTRGPPSVARSHDPSSPPIKCIVTSITDLEEKLKDLKDPESELHAIIKNGQEQMITKYFQTFIEEFEKLKPLQKHFDEKIHACLYDYFFDIASHPGYHDLQNIVNNNIENLNDEDKLVYYVKYMYDTSRRWHLLFKGTELHQDVFNIESYEQVSNLKSF